MAARLEHFVEPHVERHLIVTEGEQIIDEVGKHPIVYVWPTIVTVAGGCCFLAMPLAGRFFALPVLLGIALCGWGLLKIHQFHMDRFVVTTMRVFRVHGIFSQTLATMPMTRILDVTVEQPFLGRILGYGHFTFESAAQDQGLRDIRFVADPERRDLTIQRTIQRAGIRKQAQPWDEIAAGM